MALYESAMSALQQRDVAPSPTAESTTHGLDDPYYLDHSSSETVSKNRMLSISQQISILEGKMAMCKFCMMLNSVFTNKAAFFLDRDIVTGY